MALEDGGPSPLPSPLKQKQGSQSSEMGFEVISQSWILGLREDNVVIKYRTGRSGNVVCLAEGSMVPILLVSFLFLQPEYTEHKDAKLHVADSSREEAAKAFG